jgi:hypothetical protein
MSQENAHDPRARLVREKYFSLRPKPLERWLWSQGVTSSAERVFWLHWQEGLQRGDWCSELPLRRVARECCLDLSTVTRAYQLLIKLGCVRRTDPGRDSANPFNQATAITEVRVPRELLVELDRHPNRRVAVKEEQVESNSHQHTQEAASTPTVKPTDPFAGMKVPERRKAMAILTGAMSAGERSRYHDALITHQGYMAFDVDSTLSAEQRGQVLQFLSCLAVKPAKAEIPVEPRLTTRLPRKLTVFEIARLKRDLQSATSCAAAPELMRQVVWAIEEGSLNRFSSLHAMHIALKKIREGAWTRPNRMPPNWARSFAAPETCAHA